MSKLQSYLQRHEITQAKFAERLGVTQPSVSKLCGESPKISPALAAQIERETGGEVPFTSWPQFAVFSDRANQGSESAA